MKKRDLNSNDPSNFDFKFVETRNFAPSQVTSRGPTEAEKAIEVEKLVFVHCQFCLKSPSK